MAFLAAFRYGVGIDTITYMATYQTMPNLSEISSTTFIIYRFQPLFTLTCVVCKSICSGFWLIQFLQSFIFYHSFYLLLNLFKVRKFYLLFIFFCYMYFASGMAAMRESFALSFCFYGLYFYYRNKGLIVYYIFVVIGFLYHTGAVLFLLVPFYELFKRNTNKNFLFFFFSVLILTVLAGTVQSFLGDYVGGDGSIQRYKLDGARSGISLVTILRCVFEIFLTYYICVAHKQKTRRIPTSILYLGVSYILIDLLSSTLTPILFRFSSHLCIYHLICIKFLLEDKRVKGLLLLAAILSFYYQPVARMAFLFNDNGTFDYYSILSVDKSYTDKKIRDADTSDYIIIRK